jgi:hypothetical protein
MWRQEVCLHCLPLEPVVDSFSLDQYQALVSKVTVQCSTSSPLQLSADSLSYMYGSNDTTGVPTVYASNHTGLLNSGPASHRFEWPLALLALGSAAALSW